MSNCQSSSCTYSNADRSNVDMVAAARQYDAVSLARTRIFELTHTLNSIPGWSIDQQWVVELELDLLLDQQVELANKLADLRADSLALAAMKAKVLLDWLDAPNDSVSEYLARSLCEDLLAIACATRRSENVIPDRKTGTA